VKKIELKSVPAAYGMSTGVRIPRGQTLLQIGTAGTVWRVLTGAFRLERPTGGGQTVVHLALAGDLVGVEALCAEPYACTVTALVDSVATPEPTVGEAALSATLAAALLQQQRQSLDMALMRSGTAPVRLGHLLGLLARGFDVAFRGPGSQSATGTQGHGADHRLHARDRVPRTDPRAAGACAPDAGTRALGRVGRRHAVCAAGLTPALSAPRGRAPVLP
jgi:hypothetical protein